MKRVLFLLILWLGPACADSPQRCARHGGVAGCDARSGLVLCNDGELDINYHCSPHRSAPGHRKSKSKAKPDVKVLKFKPETTHGQILKPGQKPPPTTLEQSQKDLSK